MTSDLTSQVLNKKKEKEKCCRQHTMINVESKYQSIPNTQGDQMCSGKKVMHYKCAISRSEA